MGESAGNRARRFFSWLHLVPPLAKEPSCRDRHFDVSGTHMKVDAAAAKPRRYTQGARAQAAEATALRIVDAFLTRLMKQWFDEITLDGVAEDAGVTVQTVVRRFGGK